jgi:hypothetical protein
MPTDTEPSARRRRINAPPMFQHDFGEKPFGFRAETFACK